MKKRERIEGYIIGLMLFLMGTYTVVGVMIHTGLGFAEGLIFIIGLLMAGVGGFLIIALLYDQI